MIIDWVWPRDESLVGGIMKAFWVLSLGLVLAACEPLFGACVPLNSTILLFDEYDASTCAAQVEEAAKLGNRNINILFMGHYELNTEKKVVGYCFRTEGVKCTSVTPELLERMHGHWNACLKAVAKHNLGLSAYLQIDEGTTYNTWRNNLDFDPLKKYGDYSYDDLLTRPLAEMIAESTSKDTQVEFSLQGEMGATIAFHPKQYMELIKLTKQRLAGFKKLSIGVNVNYAASLGFGTTKEKLDLADVQRLLNAVDFVGVSTYHEVMIPTDPDDFRLSYDSVKTELRNLGLRIPTGKKTRISEIGMGGGNFTDDGASPAPTIEILAAALWSGIRGTYNPKIDPFKDPKMGQFRRDYYAAMLKYLAAPPPELNLRTAYLWNSDSWDIQGLYPSTRGWQDDIVMDMIKKHNESCGAPRGMQD